MSGFDLLDNPFAVIGVSLRATRAQINNAIEDALFADDSPVRQRELDNARQALFSPRLRLEAEVGFLSSSDEKAIEDVLISLRRGKTTQSADNLIGFDRANYLAHRCATGKSDARARTAKSLVYAYDEVSFDQLLADIRLARDESGFGAIDIENARSAFYSVRARHAEAALEGLLSLPSGPEVVASLAGELAEIQSRRHEFVAQMINQYEVRMGPEIEQAAKDVLSELGKLGTQNVEGAIEPFETALVSWDRLAQPLQVADAARGIDEAHSRQLFSSIRERYLALCNEQALYTLAARILEVAKRVFAELPDVASLIDRDIAALADLVANEQLQVTLLPLKTLVEAAVGNLADLGREVRSPRNSQQFNALLAEFDSILEQGNPDLTELAVGLIRSLAIKLANDIEDHQSALVITDALLLRENQLTDEILYRLQNDRDILKGNVEAASMTPITSAPSLTTINGCGFKLYGHTDGRPDGSFLATYYFVLLFFPIFPIARYRVIVEGSRYFFLAKVPLRRFDFWHLLISVAIIGMPAINLFQPSQSTSSSPSYVAQQPEDPASVDIPSEAVPAPASYIPAPTDEPQASFSDDIQEHIPPLSSYGAEFDRSEIRYCMMQKKRLEFAKDAAINPTEDQAQRFNSAVEDYNSRCSSFRYKDSDMIVIEQEVSDNAERLRSEGEAILNGDN